MPQPIIPRPDLEAWLHAHPDWSVVEGKLHRVFRFEDFSQAFAWMGHIAAIAEAINHHPEWLNVYATVQVWLTTHDAGGLTQLDLQLAEAMAQSHT